MRISYLLVLSALALFSCRMPYNPDVDSEQKILVVDAFISNQPQTSYVRLTLALPHDSSGNYPTVQNADVFITDNNNKIIPFEEVRPGFFEPVDYNFAGELEKSYVLTVTTEDGNTFESRPQIIMPDMEPVKVYGGYDKIEYLKKDAFGKTIKVSEKVCATYMDYSGINKTPRFRYQSVQMVEYFDIVDLRYNFYCWVTEKDNSLRFTDEDYNSSSINIYKQEVCYSPAMQGFNTPGLMQNPAPDSEHPFIYSEALKFFYEYKRIIEIKQYRLNEDSYNYYKAVKKQSEAEGKIFDPIISQLRGNITCVSDPSKVVFGFFEASNLSVTSYEIHRNSISGLIDYTRIDNIPQHPDKGFSYNVAPDFWVK